MSVQGVIFAGGGTGGHIFPAVAIAEQLNRVGGDDHPGGASGSQIPIAYLCSTREIDLRILEPRDCDFTQIPAVPFSARPRSLIRFLCTWRGSVRACKTAILDRCKLWGVEPASVAVVATGGFVCAPAARAARSLGCSVTLVNLDAVPGKAARLLARRADHVFTTYPAFGVEPIGPIVRSEALAPDTPEQCRVALGLDPAKPTLVVSGASQGAQSLNGFVLMLVEREPSVFEGWQILHQAGPDRVHEVEAAYAQCSVPSRVVGLLDDVGLMWGSATLAIARAGAGTVAELDANGVESIFFPYPYHHDDHQKRNAQPMADAGRATILQDFVNPEQNMQAHAAQIKAALNAARERKTRYLQRESSDGALEIAKMLRNL